VLITVESGWNDAAGVVARRWVGMQCGEAPWVWEEAALRAAAVATLECDCVILFPGVRGGA